MTESQFPRWLNRPYKYIRLQWLPAYKLLRLRTNVKPIQCYSLAAMAELNQVFTDISDHPGEVMHYVMTSDAPGVFNFGGDLSLFVLLIKGREVDALRLYARKCIDLVHWMETAASRGVYTTVLVQGDTLGGGLESVMPFHRVIFERSATGGFPEVLFNLFPGMGAWQFTIRKAGFDIANEMILSGRLYGAQELHDKGIVDLVVEDGQGEEAIGEIVRAVHPRHKGILAALKARSIACPITYESLNEVVEQWVDAAMSVTDRDLKIMERLAKAQIRKHGGEQAAEFSGAVGEIKRMELDQAIREEHTGVTAWGAL